MTRLFDMGFKEKSTALMLGIFLFVYGGYFFRFADRLQMEVADTIHYQTELAVMVGLLVVLAIIGHIAIFVLAPDESDREDERDRVIEQRGNQWGGYVLTAAALGAMALAMIEQPHVYIAHLLLAGLVLAEIAKGAVMLVSYRRGY
jgi:hypothetical protein